MKKWVIPGILTVLLLVGTVLVLGFYFIEDLMNAALAEDPATAASSSSLHGVVTSEETSEETTKEETTKEETTKEETTEEETTREETTKEETTKEETSEQIIIKDDPVISGTHAFVYDMASSTYLYSYGSKNEHLAPASITKLFSAFVALQYMELDTVVTAGEEVSWIDPQSSRAWMYQGQRISVKHLIQGMIIPSGNDAAYILAVAAGRKIAGDPDLGARAAYDTFVAEMNRQAAIFKLTGSHFMNPDGIDEDGHYTTLADLVTIGQLALRTPAIREAAATNYIAVTFASGESVEWSNSNKLIRTSYPAYYQEDACGLKTGSTENAGNCLLSAFRKGNNYLLICVMGCPKYDGRFEDTITLYKHFQ